MDSDNPQGIVLPLIILIAVLAACGILSMIMLILTGVVALAG